jgi:hypothetical protein
MKLSIATRQKVKMKLAIQGPSGSGKTLGSIKIAEGLCPDWNKIAVIDSENHSASLYAHLGQFNVLNISSPFTPEKYIEAIKICNQAGMEVIVIDSCSHLWEGPGGILEIHNSMLGNSFTNWSKVMPRFNAFIQSVLQTDCHIICTFRSKQDYIIVEKNGKQVPEKVGLKSITKDGIDYEFTIGFELDIRHNTYAAKDRTGLFMDKPAFRITTEVGKTILRWCNEDDQSDIHCRIEKCKTIGELLSLYQLSHHITPEDQIAFSSKKQNLLKHSSNSSLVNKIRNGSKAK